MPISETLLTYFNSPTAAQNISDSTADSLERFLRDNPFGVRVGSGYRSPDRQAELLRDKIKQQLGPEAANRWSADVAAMGPEAAGEQWQNQLRGSGITAWVALPGRSNHQKGTAFDLEYSNDDARKWAHENAAKYGLHFPMSHEPWHVEPIGSRDGATAIAALEKKPADKSQPDVPDSNKSQASAPPSQADFNRPYGTSPYGTDAWGSGTYGNADDRQYAGLGTMLMGLV